MSVYYILILLNSETLHTYVALRDLLYRIDRGHLQQFSGEAECVSSVEKTGWKAADVHGSVDRVVSDMQLKHSIQSVGPLGELAGSTRSLTVARAVGRPARSVTWRFWILGAQRGKSRQWRLKQIRRVFINHWLTDDSGDRQRVSEEPVD